jgi:predicted transcriptional regulator
MTSPTVSHPTTLTLEGARDLLKAEVFCGEILSVKIEDVAAADLMSDVLALSKPGMLLLTGLVSTQVIRTAIVVDLCGVVFVHGKKPGEDVVSLAREAGIPVLGTAHTMFEAAGLLYMATSGR